MTSFNSPGGFDAPPTNPGALGGRESPTVWPTWVGIVAIVFGAFGVLGGLCGAFGSVAMKLLLDVMPDNPNLQVSMEASQQYQGWGVGLGVIALGLGAWLLLAGIMLVKRRQSAVGHCRNWAIVKIIFVVLNSIIAYFIQQETMKVMQEQMAESGGPTGLEAMQSTMTVVGLIVGLAWGWVLPIFMLIWFGREAIKAETSTWT